MRKRINGKEAVKILLEGGQIYMWKSSLFDEVLYLNKNKVILFKEGSVEFDSKFKLQDILKYDWWISYSNSEYNLTIQQIIQKENIGKYYQCENGDVFRLTLNKYNNLELLLVFESDGDIDLYKDIKEIFCLEAIVTSKYKEVHC